MRCRKCGIKAVINMRQHRLSLCTDHFFDWMITQTERFIKKYEMFSHHERVLIAVSGGKDSLALWDILWRLGYKVDGLYMNLGINGGIDYSKRSQQYAMDFAKERDLTLIIYDVNDEIGKTVIELAENNGRGQQKHCSICGLIKRHVMNATGLRNGYEVLVTAHNLDDEAAILLSNMLNWSLNFLARGQPLLPAGPGFLRKAKPFCRIYERETAAYTILRGIKYMEEECHYSKNNKQLNFKAHLNDWEEAMPGTKLRFYTNYLQAINRGAFPERQEAPTDLLRHLCPSCGQPTTSKGFCSFCKITRV